MRLTLSEEELELMQELYSRDSLCSLQYTIPGYTLAPFQCKAVAQGLITRACLFNVDTGLGKTLIAAAIMRLLLWEHPGHSWLYICQCSNLSTTTNKLQSYLPNASIISCDSTGENLYETFCTLRASSADIIVISYEAIVDSCAESALFTLRERLFGVILDESQLLSNLSSYTSRLISAIINSATYKFCLSATPLRVNVDQVVNQIYMLDRDMFDDMTLKTFTSQYKVWDEGKVVGYQNLEELAFLLSPRTFSITRENLGLRGEYIPRPILCTTHLASSASMEQIIAYKAEQNSETMHALIQLAQRYILQNKQILVYANLDVLKEATLQALQTAGFRTAIFDGRHTNTQAKKDKVHRAFLAKELDVLITNISTGKDLPCDCICFYELTFDYKQMLGRGERGLSGVNLEIAFILTDTQYEFSYFECNVYQRGILLEKLCQKSLPELHSTMLQLRQQFAAKCVIPTSPQSHYSYKNN